MKRTTGIDIIVPVYNALEDLKLCVESLKKHTDLQLDRVILIDDKSPDAAVYHYLKGAEMPGMVVLQNEKNLGFSGTVNRGLQQSCRDVVLLNADTIVTANWVDKLVACAYSDAAIGTVTPFSNNATLCSIPNFCEENTVPQGMSIDSYAALIERCSLKKYPRITVAVGFCMYIKREVIQRVGLFDAETFQRGYGEENDFCWRAEQMGYTHVLCDDTYIYHSGTVSFQSEEKRRLIAEHEKILQDRYPKQVQENAEYVRDNPHQYLRENVALYTKLHNGKKNLLYVLHMDFRADAINNIGGTQFHVKDLAMQLRKENNVFVLARNDSALCLTAYLEEKEMTFRFRVGTKPVFQRFEDPEISRVFRQILAAFSIDAVHVHHISDLCFDIFADTKDLGIPLLLTLHDYYYICPTVKLLEGGSSFCGGQGENCADCLHKQLGYAERVDYLPLWRENCRKVLNLCDVLITPSQAAKDVYAAVYPELADAIRVIPHGMDAFAAVQPVLKVKADAGVHYRIEHALEKDYEIRGWAYREGLDSRRCEIFVRIEDEKGKTGQYQTLAVSRADVAAEKGSEKYSCCGFCLQIPDAWFQTGKLRLQLVIRNGEEEFCSDITTLTGYRKREKKRRRIAFLGGLNEAKGSGLAYEMIKQGGNTYDWYIIGGIGDANLITLEKANVRKTGWYKRETVGTILQQNGIDLVCILPIWPETFCYTVSEAQLAGVPILATDMGALGQRLQADGTGWLISHTMPVKDILKTIDGIFADEEAYRQVQQRTAEFCHQSIEAMCRQYDEIYRSLPAVRLPRGEFDAQKIYTAYVMGGAETAGGEGTEDLIRRITELETTLKAINESLEYKMVKFFNREKMPCKRFIKWCIGFAYRVYKKFRR